MLLDDNSMAIPDWLKYAAVRAVFAVVVAILLAAGSLSSAAPQARRSERRN